MKLYIVLIMLAVLDVRLCSQTTRRKSRSLCRDKCKLRTLDCKIRNGHLKKRFTRFQYGHICKRACNLRLNREMRISSTKCIGKCDTDFMLCEGSARSIDESFACLNHRHHCDGNCIGIRVTKT